MYPWERDEGSPALPEVVGEHGSHHVTPSHQERPVTVEQTVLQLEGDVREGLESCLAFRESLQLAGDGERAGEAVVDVTEVRLLTQVV